MITQVIWRLRYALCLRINGGMPIRWGWSCSEEAWHDYGQTDSPEECAIEEMSYWNE